MTGNRDDIKKVILDFTKDYTNMNICGVIINCPYWMNKLGRGQERIRGFLDGKGDIHQIRDELVKRLGSVSANTGITLTREYLQKFARRERIGIDCSGFIFRALDKLIHHKYRDCTISDIYQVFTMGISRTNADTLTGQKYCIPVRKISDYRLGDMIRIRGERHVAIILDNSPLYITYAHSSLMTKTSGVHLGKIKILNIDKSLGQQEWLEETKKGENYGKKYFDSKKGDGVYRLKIFI